MSRAATRRTLMRPAMPAPVPRQDVMAADDGRRLLTTADGDSCINLRSRRAGVLEGVATPQSLAPCAGKPCFADIRAGRENVFSVDGDGALRLEFARLADGTLRTEGKTLLTVAPGDASAARVGDFLVVRDAAGELYYLLWQAPEQSYAVLGRIPQMPVPEVTVTDGAATFPAAVEAMDFPEPVDDLRAGIPAGFGEKIGVAVGLALKRARTLAHESGLWTSPVLVRCAVRLWDGTLLHVSAPKLMMPVSYASPRRMRVPVVSASGKFTGTGAATADVPAYGLEVSVSGDETARWSDVIAAIEIWVSEDVDPEDATGSPSVGYTVQGTSHNLWVTPPLKSEYALAAALSDAGYVRVGEINPASETRTVHIYHPSPGSAPVSVSAADTTEPPAESAVAICGHGGFLHLAGYSSARPLPSLPGGMPGASETADCSVTVTIASTGGHATVSAKGMVTADKGLIKPWLWYPDRHATSMTVRLCYADGRKYERTFFLRPASSGERGACFISAAADGLPLGATGQLSVVPSDTPAACETDRLLTTRRGNPFVARSVTPGAGGSIRYIEAQQCGGGAYTRQYVYLFTDAGIVAVTHDMSGVHCNCRPLSRRVVSDPSKVAAAEGYVWALDTSGALVALRDARVDVPLKGLDAGNTVAASVSAGEVWLIPDAGSDVTMSMVIDADAYPVDGVTARQSTVVASGVVRGSSSLLLTVPFRRPATPWQVILADRRSPDAAKLPAEWVSPVVVTESGGLCNVLLEIGGDAVEASAEVYAVPPRLSEFVQDAEMRPGVLLNRFSIRGACGGVLKVPMLLPSPRDNPGLNANRLRLVVRGTFDTLTAYGLEFIS